MLQTLWARVKGRLVHIGLAGLAKWGGTAGLIVYLKAHGHRPIWGIMVGLAVGAAILVSAFWPSAAPPPPPQPPA